MQGTLVRSLVCKDPTCYGATDSTHHNYSTHMLQWLKPLQLDPVIHTREATKTRSLHTTRKSSARLLQLEKVYVQQWRLTTTPTLKKSS